MSLMSVIFILSGVLIKSDPWMLRYINNLSVACEFICEFHFATINAPLIFFVVLSF